MERANTLRRAAICLERSLLSEEAQWAAYWRLEARRLVIEGSRYHNSNNDNLVATRYVTHWIA